MCVCFSVRSIDVKKIDSALAILIASDFCVDIGKRAPLSLVNSYARERKTNIGQTSFLFLRARRLITDAQSTFITFTIRRTFL